MSRSSKLYLIHSQYYVIFIIHENILNDSTEFGRSHIISTGILISFTKTP